MRTARRPCVIALQPESVFRPFVFLTLLSLLIFGTGAARAASCTDAILAAEKEFGIPSGLLLAIALVESGNSGAPAAYAMNVGGKPIMAKSEADAAKYLRDSRGRLRQGVMAGCMQLSLAHHKAAFHPVERIVSPVENVRYAARYLGRLKSMTGSWAKAVVRYNGASGKKAQAYQCNVQRRLVSLDADAASLFDGLNCSKASTPRISTKTRNAFQTAASEPVS